MRGLKGKVAAVTGAGSGIGQAAAQRLGEEGCKVAVLDRNAEGARQTVDSIIKRRRRCDRDHRRCQRRSAASRPHSRRSSPDTAGSTSSSPTPASFPASAMARWATLPKSVWDEIVGVNLTGHVSRPASMASRRSGRRPARAPWCITGSPTGMSGCTPGSSAYSSQQGRRARPLAGHGNRLCAGGYPGERRGAGLHAVADRARAGRRSEGLRVERPEHSVEARRRAGWKSPAPSRSWPRTMPLT